MFTHLKYNIRSLFDTCPYTRTRSPISTQISKIMSNLWRLRQSRNIEGSRNSRIVYLFMYLTYLNIYSITYMVMDHKDILFANHVQPYKPETRYITLYLSKNFIKIQLYILKLTNCKIFNKNSNKF